MTSEVRDKRTYTLAEFTRLPDNGKRYELVKGKLVEMAQPGDLHGRVGSKLLTRLADFVEDHKLGLIYIPTGFVLENSNPKRSTVRAPAVAFLQTSRVPAETLDGVLPIPPDLALEVVSPSDVWTKVDDKVDEYLHAGVAMVWVVYPRRQVAFVHQPDQPMLMLLGPRPN